MISLELLLLLFKSSERHVQLSREFLLQPQPGPRLLEELINSENELFRFLGITGHSRTLPLRFVDRKRSVRIFLSSAQLRLTDGAKFGENP